MTKKNLRKSNQEEALDLFDLQAAAKRALMDAVKRLNFACASAASVGVEVQFSVGRPNSCGITNENNYTHVYNTEFRTHEETKIKQGR
jgi:hypothetical protein